MPKVSIIVPNYNHAQYLSRRLDSILCQSLQDFEVIFLDDASSDDSLRKLEPYLKDPRIKVSLNQENSGSPFAQWNKGFDLARGEYLWIAESDDYAESTMLETLVSALENNPDVGLAYCQSLVVTSDHACQSTSLLKIPYEGFSNSERWQRDYVNSGTDEIVNYLVFNNTISNASAVILRRSLLDMGLRAPENMRLTGDWMFWVQVLLQSNLAYVAEPLNYFREAHAGSQRDKTKKEGLELIEGLEVYSCITQNLVLGARTKNQALRFQVRLWAVLSCLRQFSWETNKGIYKKLVRVHASEELGSFKSVFLPFALFYLSAPLRKIPGVVSFYRSLLRVSQRK